LVDKNDQNNGSRQALQQQETLPQLPSPQINNSPLSPNNNANIGNSTLEEQYDLIQNHLSPIKPSSSSPHNQQQTKQNQLQTNPVVMMSPNRPGNAPKQPVEHKVKSFVDFELFDDDNE
jgi:hypothetical protein